MPSESVAEICKETLLPSMFDWSEGCAGLTMGLTVQVNVWQVLTVPLVAETSTVYGPSAAAPAAIVPVIKPVDVFKDKPAGSPLAP